MKDRREYYAGFAGLEMREENGKKPRLIGYAAVFNSRSQDLGGFVELVRPGAFRRSLASDQDVLALVEHDPREILARRRAGNLTVAEDERGLRVEIEPPDTHTAENVIKNVRAGNLDGMSFAFSAREFKWDFTVTPNTRELFDVDLYDVSVVAFPAYRRTEVTVRSYAEALAEYQASVASVAGFGLDARIRRARWAAA